jgi:hypothetical protein
MHRMIESVGRGGQEASRSSASVRIPLVPDSHET